MQEVQEDPETLLKLQFTSEGKNSRKALVEKAGNRGRGVFSHRRSLGANVTGKFLTAIPAAITHRKTQTQQNIPGLSPDHPSQESKSFLSFPFLSTLQPPNSHCQQRREAAGMFPCQEERVRSGWDLEMLHAPREGGEGMREGGQSLPGLPLPSRGCLTVLHNQILVRLFN